MDIHSKETKHTSHDKAARTSYEKNSISHKISQYSTNATNRIQGTIKSTKYRTQKNKQNIGKQQNTQKQQNTKTRRKLLPGIEPGPSSL
jgi:hypothetical protein